MRGGGFGAKNRKIDRSDWQAMQTERTVSLIKGAARRAGTDPAGAGRLSVKADRGNI